MSIGKIAANLGKLVSKPSKTGVQVFRRFETLCGKALEAEEKGCNVITTAVKDGKPFKRIVRRSGDMYSTTTVKKLGDNGVVGDELCLETYRTEKGVEHWSTLNKPQSSFIQRILWIPKGGKPQITGATFSRRGDGIHASYESLGINLKEQTAHFTDRVKPMKKPKNIFVKGGEHPTIKVVPELKPLYGFDSETLAKYPTKSISQKEAKKYFDFENYYDKFNQIMINDMKLS